MLSKCKIHYALSLLVSLIPAALVAGAAILEFFIFISCLIFFYINWKKLALNYYYKNYFFIIFFLFCLFLIFGSLSSDYILNSIKNSLFYFRFGILTLIIWYLLDHYKKFKFLFFASLTATLSIVILYSFVQLLILKNQLDVYRISGIFGTESVQGSFLLRIIPIFIILFFYSKKYLNKIIHYTVYLILFFAFILIILSGERAAVFLMLASILLLIIFFKIKLKKIFIILSFIFLTFYLTFSFYPDSKVRIIDTTYKQVFITTDHKKVYIFSEGHQNHFKSALIMFKQHYIMGVGVRNFRMECEKDIYKKVGKYYCTTHPHNTYMQLLSETGLVGLSFILFFMTFIFTRSIEFLKNIYIQNHKINRPLGLVYIIIIINFFPFITTGSFFNNWLSAIYFLPIGFLLHELNLKKLV